MLSVTGPGPAVDEPRASAAQPALQAEPGAVREVRPRRGDALRRSRRPLPDLERAERVGLARAAADVRGAARLLPRLPAPLPRPRARRAAGDRARGPGRAGPARRARAARSHRDLDAQPGLAAAVPARAGVRGPALQEACAAVRAAASGRRARTPSATTRTGSSSAPRPQPGPRPGEDRRPAAPVRGARPPHALGAHRRAGAALRRLPDRVRLPDLAARPRRRHQPRPPDALPPAGVLPGLAAAAGAQPHPVPVARRAGHRPRPRAARVRRLAVRAALRQRPAQAGLPRLHRAVRHRLPAAPPPRPLLGPDPARDRRPHRHRAAPAPRPAPVPGARADAHRRARLLEPHAPGRAAREVPLRLGAGRRHRRRRTDAAAVGDRPAVASDPARQWHASRP